MATDFYELFEPIPHISVRPFVFRDDVEGELISSVDVGWVDELRVKQINQKLGYDYVIVNSDIPKLRDKPDLLKKIISENEDIFIITCEQLHHNYMNYQKLFVPTSEIMDKIKLTKEKISEYTIGVHIRRTDNEKSISHSPDTLFDEIIDREIKNGMNVFLATDDRDVESWFLRKYPQHIFVQSAKEFSRGSITGVKDALVDMFCLSYTSHIYGSYWSSYSAVASRVNDTRLTILKSAD